MSGLNQEFIAEVRQRASIVEVISEFVVLKRAGKAGEYKGLCPFHQEKSPSFTVNGEKGFFKCFGCGAAGDAFSFMQKVKGLDFVDTVRDLAQKYNVTLVETQEDRKEWDKRSLVYMLYQKTCEYFRQQLNSPESGVVAREYLHKRQLSAETIEKFMLGYAPNSWDGLLNFLTRTTQVAPATLEEAGLVRKRPDSSGYYDLFRNRLMIPICDDRGRVIAFGGRTLGDDQAKYINSPATPIYTKGEHLFALHLAKESIKERDAVIVVEGYFDAITPHQFGFTNTVASLGTALTEQQARALVRYTDSKRVFLGFDADAAGERAVDNNAERLTQVADGVGIELRVIAIPGGKDPDECLRSPDGQGSFAFAKALEDALSLTDYQLEKAMGVVDAKTHSGRIDASKRVVPILAQIKNNVARGEYIRQMALKLNLREEELLSDVGQYRRDKGFGRSTPAGYANKSYGKQDFEQTRPPGNRNAMKAGFVEAEQQLLALFLTDKDEHDRVSVAIAEDVFFSPVHQRIKEALAGLGNHFNNVEDLQFKLMDRLGPDKEAAAALIEVILKVEETRTQNPPIETVLVGCKGRLVKELLSRTMTKTRALLPTSSSDVEQETLQSKIIQLKGLEQKLVSAATLDELDELRRKIEGIAGA
jgi:DNA primase